MKLLFRQIEHRSPEYEKAVAVRTEVLRRPLGLVFTPQELEKEATQYHLAAYSGGELVGCVILAPGTATSLQMRQVAVAKDRQNEGIGKQLVSYAETFAREKGATEIYLHARENALTFYKSLGYQTYGDVFMEVQLPHYHMKKSLLQFNS